MSLQFSQLATDKALELTVNSLRENNFFPVVLEKSNDALKKIKDLIPDGTSIMNGGSITLKEIGYVDFLKSGKHKWNNLHEKILQEKNPEKKLLLRQESLLSDFYLGSAHAVTENGEIMIASYSGSQLPHLAFTSKNIILVVGTQKIVKDISEGFKRIEEYVKPLEDQRMKDAYGIGTMHAKTLILHKEPAIGRQIHIIFVKEKLGF